MNKEPFWKLLIPGRDYVVTPLLVYINVGILLAMAIKGVNILHPGTSELIAWGADYKPLTLRGQWWRLVTGTFIHLSPPHLLFNMNALLFVGSTVERYTGKSRFLTAYLLSGVLGGMVSSWWHPGILSAGASGAIFGIYGLFGFLLLTNLVDKKERLSELIAIVILLGYNLLAGMGKGVDNAAHIGGLLGGIVIGGVLYNSLVGPQSFIRKHAGLGLAAGVIAVFCFILFSLIPPEVLEKCDRLNDLAAYRKEMNKLSDEIDIIHAYNALWKNKADAETVVSTLTELTPKYERFRNRAAAVTPQTRELKDIQSVYLEGVNLQLKAFHGFQKAYSSNDKALLRESLSNERRGNAKIQEYKALLKAYAEKNRL